MKQSKYIGTFDDSQKLSISKLSKQVGLIVIPEDESATARGTLHWSSGGKEFASVRYTIYLNGSKALLQLNFNTDEEKEVEQFIAINSKGSNLGVGVVWYFVCPITKKNCNTLIYHNGKFAHRSLHESAGMMYAKQKESKLCREFNEKFGNEFESERLYRELHSKHFKKSYNGKPTKRFLRIVKRIKEIETKLRNREFNEEEFMSYYLSK